MALNFPTNYRLNSYGPAKIIILDTGAAATDPPFTIYDSNEIAVFQVREDGAVHYTDGWFLADFDSILRAF